MQTINTQFEHELGKLIDEEIARLTSNLAAGAVVQDFPQYRHITGQIRGLERAKSYCDEVNTLLSKR